MDIGEQQHQFADWMREHGGIVHHVVNGFATGDDRNDLLQEVLLAIWKSIPAFRATAKPTTFLYRVCHNAALRWIRTERRHSRRVERFAVSVECESAPKADSVTDERLTQLYSAIHGLRAVDRSLMLLLLEGLSYREMAEILGLSESNVGVKINRIKSQLSQTLKGNEHEPQ